MALGGILCVGCNQKAAEPRQDALGEGGPGDSSASGHEATAPVGKELAVNDSPTGKPAKAESEAPHSAKVGQPAPAFSLKDLTGQDVSLEQFRDKTVVLEWFNPNCPFVKAAHTKGSLVDAAARAMKEGVVWLAINSGAAGKQGHGKVASQAGKLAFAMNHPILLDESGEVGRSYGATNTPHIFIIDGAGTLVYAGAVDNSPDGEGESPTSGTLVSYVDKALAEIASGKPVSTSQTKAYGCSVKY